jgi:SAM-dependent methyltransferase
VSPPPARRRRLRGASLDSRERFSATASNYRRYRPSYPGALFDWLERAAGLGPRARVADVGCGTGISTRQLAGRGWDVVGVDPNPEMLEQARREGGARYARGEASDTGLPAASFDLVSAAQAYHWFDVPASLVEFRRILRPEGRCAAFWNLRGEGAFMDGYDALLRAHATDYAVLLKPAETIAAIKAQPATADVLENSFANSQRLDRDALFGRAYSSSYVVHGLRDKDGFDRALQELHARHAIGGEVEFPYRCVALLWRIE